MEAEHTTAVQSKYKMIKPISNLSIINVFLEIVISHDRLFPNCLSVGKTTTTKHLQGVFEFNWQEAFLQSVCSSLSNAAK